jgi:hypothetical protein
MLSMPPAIPTSICPTAIEFAILVIALRPDAQARFTVLKDVVVGMPTWLAAMRPAFEPPSSASTVPIHISSIFAGSRLGNLEIVALRT